MSNTPPQASPDNQSQTETTHAQSESTTTVPKQSVPSSPPTKPKKIKKKRDRCSFAGCNKKASSIVGLCKCGYTFCSLHRLPEAHVCAFNHREHDRMFLKKSLEGGGAFAKLEKV